MFTQDQTTQLILLVNRTFSVQLEFTHKKQSRSATPTLRPLTPRTPTPIPADSPIKFWGESYERVLEAGDKLQRLNSKTSKDEEDIDKLKEKARALKNEYRELYMQFSGDNSPEQANAIYQTAQEAADLVFKAAYRDLSRNATEDAKAQFIASFTIALMTKTPNSRLQATTESSKQSSEGADFAADNTESLANTFSTITI